eukprot:319334_1
MLKFKWSNTFNVIDVEKCNNSETSIFNDKNTILVIGYNYFGELNCLNHNIMELTELKSFDQDIANIHSGNGNTVYVNSNTRNKGLYIAGNNKFGSCPIVNMSHFDCVPLKTTYVESTNIKTIFMNVCSDSMFIKTNQNKIYGNGRISQLGIGHTQYPFNRYNPTLINNFNNINVVNIASGTEYSIALCGYSSNTDSTIIIIEHWATKCINIPIDVLEIIRKYYCILNHVFITSSLESERYDYDCDDSRLRQNYKSLFYNYYSFGADCNHYYCHGLTSSTQWKMVKWPGNIYRHIIKVAAASVYCLLLEQNGNVWSCHPSKVENLNIRHEQKVQFELELIVSANKVQIHDIKCGNEHSLAVDNHGHLYSWGDNTMGQCGYGIDDVNINTELSSISMVGLWLKSIKYTTEYYDKYYKLFVENGITSLSIVQKLTKNNLNVIVENWLDRCELEKEIGNLNKYGLDCWNSGLKYINTPRVVISLAEYRISEIECGYAHSYCKTLKSKHYLFGSNFYNECIVYDKNIDAVTTPHCFNKVIEKKIKCFNIQLISLGYYNTKIIVRQGS